MTSGRAAVRTWGRTRTPAAVLVTLIALLTGTRATIRVRLATPSTYRVCLTAAGPGGRSAAACTKGRRRGVAG